MDKNHQHTVCTVHAHFHDAYDDAAADVGAMPQCVAVLDFDYVTDDDYYFDDDVEVDDDDDDVLFVAVAAKMVVTTVVAAAVVAVAFHVHDSMVENHCLNLD